ncbi:MAG: flavin reductase family protein [Alphaproteobacteria bacterium]
MDQRALRNAFGSFTTGVTVITTVPEGRAPIGITANSFSSVSLDPPLVLWCLDKSSDTLDIFQAAPSFAINILADTQQDLSNRCAVQGDHGLEDVPTTIGTTGCPILEGAIAHFDCETFAKHDAGDHIIFIGKVVGFDTSDAAPLVFSRGQYRDLAD